METKKVTVEGLSFILLRYNDKWVFPFITTYTSGLGSPVAIFLYLLENGRFEPYTNVTVNLPDCHRKAGCQFIDTNKNTESILDWLEENGFGKRTDKYGKSGFCKYPEFNFYAGDKFWEYKNFRDENNIELR